MKTEACYYLGYTSKAQGKNGEIVVKLDTDSPQDYEGLEMVFMQLEKSNNILVPFFLVYSHLSGKNLLKVKFENIDSIQDAKPLIGKQIYLPLDSLPDLADNQFYYHEVIGYRVVDKTQGDIGIIQGVMDLPHQAIFEIVNTMEKEILIPIMDELILKVDRTNKQIEIEAPSGLIDLYLT